MPEPTRGERRDKKKEPGKEEKIRRVFNKMMGGWKNVVGT